MQISSSSSYASSSLLAANEANTSISQIAALTRGRGDGNARQSSDSADDQALTQTQSAPSGNGQRGSLLNIVV